MIRQIDFFILEGTAKAILEAHIPQSRRAMLEVVTMMEPKADDVAWLLTTPDDVIRGGKTLGDACAHMIGFKFGLRLGALIASNPSLSVPDLSDFIVEYHTETSRLAS